MCIGDKNQEEYSLSGWCSTMNYENCFGNFNAELISCVFCEFAVECYKRGVKGKRKPIPFRLG